MNTVFSSGALLALALCASNACAAPPVASPAAPPKSAPTAPPALGAHALGAHALGAPAPAPPAQTAMGNSKADPRAYALLEAAHNNRQVMPADFVGFSADLVYQDGDVTKKGTLVYRRAGETQITLDGLSKDDRAWLEDKTLNLIGHRRGGSFAQGDGKNPLSLVTGDENTFGPLIKLNDRINSQYRVKDGKVTEVTRTMGNTMFTITVMQSMEADPGKYLANHFSVAYRDAKTNALQMVEGYNDTYSQIDGVWLPTSRTIIEIAETVSPRVRTIDLRNIQTLKPTK